MFNTFINKKKYYEIPVEGERKKQAAPLPGYIKCPICTRNSLQQDLEKVFKICPHCGYHYPMGAWERVALVVDDHTFEEINPHLRSINILDFPQYDEKLLSAQEETGLCEAVLTGFATVGGERAVIGVMEPRFMMASMGSVVGEKVTRAIETAIEKQLPLVICVASGGARMQEGMIALMQMAKTSAAVQRLHEAGGLFVAVLTHPTTGGAYASFASLADIVIAEPGALIGFAGPRVIEQTIKQQLPEGFQRAEFLLEHGMLDMVVDRNELKATISTILKLHPGGQYGPKTLEL